MRTSPLDGSHRALGSKMVPFGGFEMPLSYPSGTVAEHLACRRDAVAFDVSHLGTVRVGGPGALRHLNRTFTNDLGRIGPGRTQYSHLLDEDASVLDDVIVWWRSWDYFDVMPNASNTSRVLAAVGGRDVTDERAVIAVQGPGARERLRTVFPEASAVARRTVATLDWRGTPCVVAGTGYTGEDGVEIAVPAEDAGALWDAIMAAGVLPAGLGARDTLRLEAGLPLHGHELGPGITPLQAGLEWVVAWHKSDFPGLAALQAEKAAGPARRLRGLLADGRQPARDRCPVRAADKGPSLGVVTSGNFSPVLGRGIALALLAPEVVDGARVEIDVRGRPLTAQVVATPFVPPRKA
ncbi:MAG: glycine cleavage system aminomethyltransferase GcvT [Acidimicrobiales bacterium]